MYALSVAAKDKLGDKNNTGIKQQQQQYGRGNGGELKRRTHARAAHAQNASDADDDAFESTSGSGWVEQSGDNVYLAKLLEMARSQRNEQDQRRLAVSSGASKRFEDACQKKVCLCE